MSARPPGFPAHLGGGFAENTPRPPVPGEEGGELASGDETHRSCPNRDSAPAATPTATPRRPDLDLGYEPEGCASPTLPYLKWAESLRFLLDDRDGIRLFRTFLRRERRHDLLDFWFACSGFRKLGGGDERAEEKRLRLARAIYRKYIQDGGGIVSRQIRPATRSVVRDRVVRPRVDAAVFDRAQAEIQAAMEESVYPSFLKSDLYLECAGSGGESPELYGDPDLDSGRGADHLKEDEEWRAGRDTGAELGGDHTSREPLSQELLMEISPQQAGTSRASQDSWECSDVILPCRYQKWHRREVCESAKANDRLALPHVPPMLWMQSVQLEPESFAAELICRLESILREREAQAHLEERLQGVRLSMQDQRPRLELSVPLEKLERNQKIVCWMVEGEKEAGWHKTAPYGRSGEFQRTLCYEVSWPSLVEYPSPTPPLSSSRGRHTGQPSHPFIQDPTMPPNPAPNPLTQLEEACRRLEAERRVCGAVHAKQRYVMEVIHRGRAAIRPAVPPPLSPVPAVSDPELSEREYKSLKRPLCEDTVVAYYFCGEPIPYRTSIRGSAVTLGQFKQLLTRKGSYRYYFKKVSSEFDCGVVFEEVREDSAILPIFQEKIIGKVEKVD